MDEEFIGNGLVFDWILARKIIKAYKATRVYVASQDSYALIWLNGKPATRPDFKFAGKQLFALVIGDEIFNCFAPIENHPDWNEDTYWPNISQD